MNKYEYKYDKYKYNINMLSQWFPQYVICHSNIADNVVFNRKFVE